MQMSIIPPAVPHATQPVSANESRLYKPPRMFSSEGGGAMSDNLPMLQQCNMEDDHGGAEGREENGYVMEGFK